VVVVVQALLLAAAVHLVLAQLVLLDHQEVLTQVVLVEC
jgi:hypothetical protein